MKYFYAIIYLNKIMDLTDINQKKEENYMDIQSPYIKNDSNSIDEVRKRITKRATTGNLIETEGKVLSFKNKEDMPESDDVLKQKVSNISKRIVGEEIKRFAEIASREIGKEFDDIEKRLNENLKSNILDLQNEIDKKIEKFNFNMKDLENRIRDLEILSISTIKKEIEKKEEQKEISLKIENKTPTILKDMRENIQRNEIKNTFSEKESDEKKEKGSNKDVKRYYASLEVREEESKYVVDKIKETVNLFEKSGLLFRKNSYTTTLKDLEMEDFLNNKDDAKYKNIDSDDKEKISKLLTNLMDTLNIDPDEGEKIEEFFKRAYRVEFQEMNSR